MKKLLNISVIAALAILPLAAQAETGDPVHSDATTGITAEATPKYALVAADANVDGVVATAGYVKGAYNSAIKAINKVSDIATNATNSANISYDGTTSGLDATNVKAAVDELASEKANKATTLAGYNIEDAYTKTQVDSAITNGAVQSVTTGTTSGTVNVDNQEVAVAGWSGKQDALNTDQMDAVNSGINATKRAAYDQLVTASGNYATKTGVTTTVTNALNAATVDISGLQVANGALEGSATASVPVVATWGATASTGNVSATVNLANVTTNVTLSGDASDIAVHAGTVAYPANE